MPSLDRSAILFKLEPPVGICKFMKNNWKQERKRSINCEYTGIDVVAELVYPAEIGSAADDVIG